MIISVPSSLNLSHRSLFSKWHWTRAKSSQLHRPFRLSAKGLGAESGVEEVGDGVERSAEAGRASSSRLPVDDEADGDREVSL